MKSKLSVVRPDGTLKEVPDKDQVNTALCSSGTSSEEDAEHIRQANKLRGFFIGTGWGNILYILEIRKCFRSRQYLIAIITETFQCSQDEAEGFLEYNLYQRVCYSVKKSLQETGGGNYSFVVDAKQYFSIYKKSGEDKYYLIFSDDNH